MATLVLILAALALLLLDVRLALWVWCAYRDHAAEVRASDLVPYLERAHEQLRDQNRRLKKLEAEEAELRSKVAAYTNTGTQS